MFKKKPFEPPLQHGSTALTEKVEHVPDGNIVVSEVSVVPLDEVYHEIGDPDDFSLEAQQMAGIPLKQVNSQILDSGELTPEVQEQIEEFVNAKLNPKIEDE